MKLVARGMAVLVILIALTVLVSHVVPGVRDSNFGRWVKKFVGPDGNTTKENISKALKELRACVDAGQEVSNVAYVVWNPRGLFGHGEHAAITVSLGSDAKQKSFVIDVGRRPKNANHEAISILRVFGKKQLMSKKGENTHITQESISDLMSNRSVHKMLRSVLLAMKRVEVSEENYVEWNYHALFNNCARYVQERIGNALDDSELRELVLNYQTEKTIAPTPLLKHLQRCNMVALAKQNGSTLSSTDSLKLIEHLGTMSPGQSERWKNYMLEHKLIQDPSSLETKLKGIHKLQLEQLKIMRRHGFQGR